MARRAHGDERMIEILFDRRPSEAELIEFLEAMRQQNQLAIASSQTWEPLLREHKQ
jgi:hypothetical protein